MNRTFGRVIQTVGKLGIILVLLFTHYMSCVNLDNHHVIFLGQVAVYAALGIQHVFMYR